MLLQEQNQCRVTHKSVSHAAQCDPVLLSQQGFFWPSGLCFRLPTIYCHPLLTWPHVTSHAHWASLNCSQVKDHCAMEGALHDRQTSDPPQSDKKARQTNICAWAHTHSQRILEPAEPPGQTGWWHRFWVITASDTDSSKGKQTNTPRGALHRQPRHLCFLSSAFRSH